MSQSVPAPRGRVGIHRILLCGILMAVLMAACLYLQYTALDFFHARMLENESKTIAWLTEQAGYILPFAVICLFQWIVYQGYDAHDGSARREMFWEVAVAAVLTYAVLLPYLSSVSEALYINALAAGEKIPRTDGKVDITLLMELHEWFIRLLIPLGILLAYHGTRARRERLFPETEALPAQMTVAEYEAQKAAARTKIQPEQDETISKENDHETD